ncbi:RluA family pseudouridine synthase [Ferroacidibacillus organovorans]|uniref:Pseudouridine synthase n=1 Tax=Ferroacidibacillus organovorans TaxID=1765683 RepID=A0A101XQL6_9BACL|nr:RluA family pseudouridine synthase [Ferroacidibacillus organovorans]KUO95747.1 hypothetical protein ATW55_05285 [Ferroacidibacillus organovorans]
MITSKILPQDSGKKLHRYLRQTLPGMPLSGVYKMIRVGRVKVNGVKGKMETVLQPGDELTLYLREEEYESLARSVRKFGGVSTDISVIHEDDHLLILNKPVGLLTHPDAQEHKDTLINRALAYLHGHGEIEHGRSFLPATVNRLDRNTSGLVLIGKDAQTLRDLAEQIRRHKIKKHYLAIVWGKLEGPGEIDLSLVRDTASQVTRPLARSLDQALGKVALTRYRPLASAAGFTLIEVELISGRTHQIRAHLQSIRHPLLGDIKYGGKPAFDVNHHLLHAYGLALADGRTFVAPPSPLFFDILQKTGLTRGLAETSLPLVDVLRDRVTQAEPPRESRRSRG